jgi:hypothetical protein
MPASEYVQPPQSPAVEEARWTKEILKGNWDRMRSLVPDSWMPTLVRPNPMPPGVLVEYGCGVYGCVYPTNEPEVVFKITSDPSEAAFVAAAMELRDWPAGMVRYHKIAELKGLTYHKRPVFVLWRNEAYNVGGVAEGLREEYLEQYGWTSCDDFVTLLKRFYDLASDARESFRKALFDQRREVLRLVQKALSGAPQNEVSKRAWDIAYILRECAHVTDVMAEQTCGGLVGDALGFYLAQGMLLCDVHGGNVGEVSPAKRGKFGELVITDPGHMMPIEERWLKVEVPSV